MAPLFSQRQKVPEDAAATTNQSQTESYSSKRMSGSSAGTSHYVNSSGIHQQSTSFNLDQDGVSNGSATKDNSSPPPLPPLRHPGPNDKITDSAAIRKYLVLLQDCLAIKFAPLVTGHQSHPFPFAFNGTNSRKNTINTNTQGALHLDDGDDDLLGSHRSPLVNPHNNNRHHRTISNGTSVKCGSNSIGSEYNTPNNDRSSCVQSHPKSSHNQQGIHVIQSSSGRVTTLNRPASTNFNGAYMGSNTAEVDHSLHALYLYKGFKDANAQCHWNSALSETFRNIQYKGYIVPSTILIGALPKSLMVMRTAWSRQMLKSPAGYRIEFLGEIEEVIADPIQKGQFAPLSDSLCYAILELTSMGHEAFVDSIMTALQVAFPMMSCPSRELVFQTLEKLIKERKVYQTSRGYFVVTPEIFRYMVSSNFHESDGNTLLMNNSQQGITLDALLHPNYPEKDKLSFSHQSWDSAVSTGDHNRCSSTSTGEELIEIAPSPKLKRHNSLKLIRQRDVAVTQMSGSTGLRRYSLRLPKSKSCGRMNDSVEDDEEVKRSKAKSSTIEHISRAMRSLRTTAAASSSSANNSGADGVDCEKSKKNKSLLSKLFPFRRSTSKPRNEKITGTNVAVTETAAPTSGCSSTNITISSSDGSMSPPTKTKHSQNTRESAKFISTQTQTSNSTEQLCLPSISVSTHPSTSSSHSVGKAKNPERMSAIDSLTPGHSAVDINMLNHHIRHRDRSKDSINGEGSHQTRSSSRRSMSILDEGPLYDVLNDMPTTNTSDHINSYPDTHHNHLSPNFQVGCPVGPPTFPAYHQRGESSRCSTLSSQAASSLGYGSQCHPGFTNNHSPNLDSGYYCGEGSCASNSHSPSGATSSANYGYNGSNPKSNGNFPHPVKPTAYSSARYKNSYEWYKKRYPNYISPVGRTSPLYASLTAPRSKSRSRPTYEALLTPVNGKHGDRGGLIQMSENRRPPSSNNNHQQRAVSSSKTKSVLRPSSYDQQSNSADTTTTTTVTQAVKSTTNMELELLLPLGKIMKAALQAKKDAIRDAWLRDELGPGYASYANKNQTKSGTSTMNEVPDNNETIKVNLENSGAKLKVGEPTTKTEVTTIVNNNGVIETHFDSSSGTKGDLVPPNMKSTVEIKTLGGVTDVVLVNGKTGEETNIMNTTGGNKSNNISREYNYRQQSTINNSNNGSLCGKISDKGSTTCVKINEIGKECCGGYPVGEKDGIKVC